MSGISGFDMSAMMTQLTDEEGERLTVYDDATGMRIVPGMRVIGHPTIGMGRALDVNGITSFEAQAMLAADVKRYLLELNKLVWFTALDGIRQRVIVDMRHQLGLHGLTGFRDMIAAIERQDWDAAAAAGLDSAWHHETPARAERLMAMLRTGVA